MRDADGGRRTSEREGGRAEIRAALSASRSLLVWIGLFSAFVTFSVRRGLTLGIVTLCLLCGGLFGWGAFACSRAQ